MISITPKEALMQVVLSDVVGFEHDGIRILDAEFRASSCPDFPDEAIVVKLILTDPPGPGYGWPSPAIDVVERHAYDTMYTVGPGVWPILDVGPEHPDYGYGRVSR